MTLNDLITKYDLNAAEQTELSEYIKNRFEGIPEGSLEEYEQLPIWQKLAALSQLAGAAEVINKKITPRLPVDFKDPDSIRLEIFDSFAGAIPIIYAGNTADFEALITNIVHRGERPENIGQTGASFVSGKSTRFIILSNKSYSNVPAVELALDEADWAEKSMLIRRSHECTHYYTKQVCGISNNILHDELMADFIGLWDAFGFYKAEWFLRFMGVIEGSEGRLVVYTEGLSEKVKQAVTELLRDAAYGLEKWSQSEGFEKLTNAERINIMCRAGILGMAEL
ncbi:MAG: hypothetical protein IJ555_07730 [Ruminococcus sp.]|nr:hypothetical protein [Ruminococcus sp.]MBR1752990.1 hypothetical protein [Ruminococcus sp.]